MAEAFTLEMLVVDAYHHSINQIATRVEALGDDPVLDAMDDEELIALWTSQFLLEPLEWDEGRQPHLDRDEAVTLSGRQPPREEMPVRRLFLPVIPKRSNPRVLTLRPEMGWVQRGRSLSPAAAYIEREAVIVLRGTKADLNDLQSTAKTLVNLINDDIDRYYRELRPTVRRMVTGRREQIRQDDEQFRRDAQHLGVEIRERHDAPRLVDVREREEVQIIRNPAPRRPGFDDPHLSPESIEKIVDLIDQAGKGFEVAPREFSKLREEGLRHVIAGYLNAVFGRIDVTGETFSKDGRPDLVIMRDGRSVMVGECKFWGGAAHYRDTLGKQLVRYIPWRHTIAVLITFATRHNLTRVVRDARQVTSEHPTFLDALNDKSETYFVSTHVHPDDSEKTVEIHHLLFNQHSDLDDLQ
ncbi:MAG: hypothetical protein M3440_01690 [Chloroflexota bacterium]|nr:hypothetical protein [Chloroflexota bacterium]